MSYAYNLDFHKNILPNINFLQSSFFSKHCVFWKYNWLSILLEHVHRVKNVGSVTNCFVGLYYFLPTYKEIGNFHVCQL